MLLFFDSVNLTIKFQILCCCCFQTFKDLLALLSLPFYWGCKGKSLYFINQNYLKKFQTFFVVKTCVRTTVFFKRVAKIRGFFNSPNFYSKFFFFSPHFFFNEQPFC